MADGADSFHVLSSQEGSAIVAAMEVLPTFPDAEDSPPSSGKGKGAGARCGARKRHASAAPHDGAAPDDEPGEFCSDDFLRQLCREEFASMRSTITEEVSATVAKN
eukprot:3397432-Pyramimonas_sp.AAC.1